MRQRNTLLLVMVFGGVAVLTNSTLYGQARHDREPRPAIYRATGNEWRVDLTPEIEEALDRYDRDFEMWDVGDYRGDLVRYEYSPRQTPWAVIGDFNGDGRPDVAVAGRDDEDALVLLVLSNGPRRYRVVEADREPIDPDDRRSVRPPVLGYLYPGRYRVDDRKVRRPRELVVQQPAVQMTGGWRSGTVIYVVEEGRAYPYYLRSQFSDSLPLEHSK